MVTLTSPQIPIASGDRKRAMDKSSRNRPATVKPRRRIFIIPVFSIAAAYPIRSQLTGVPRFTSRLTALPNSRS